jgi:hypothetical protein
MKHKRLAKFLNNNEQELNVFVFQIIRKKKKWQRKKKFKGQWMLETEGKKI